MNRFVHTLIGISFLFVFSGAMQTMGQTVFNPNDPIVVYNPASPPTQPPSGQVGKWVKTNRLSWNTSAFKSYIYKGIAFRLKYPKSFVPGNGKKYPLFLFFHGVGEKGTIYDNEYQLYHGGQLHLNAVNNDKYDGFLLYPQSSLPSGIFSTNQRNVMRDLIVNFLIPEAQVDPFRIQVNGLSGGGGATWDFMFENPKLVSAALPMSNASITMNGDLVQNKYTPVWLFQGALDTKPQPASGRGMNSAAIAAGANFTYTEYPDKGHDTWNSAWREADFYPFMLRSHKANPWPLFGRTSFCQGENISIKIGVTPGFDGYEWRKNGTLIPNADSSEITATAIGIYDCRVKRGTEWSVWSPTPVELKYKTVAVSPDIKLGEFASKVLPSPDGKTSVELVMPQGYYGYYWEKTGGSDNPVSTTYNYRAEPGTYMAKLSESASCENSFSSPFKVVDANGANKPDPVVNLIVNKQSKSSLRLDWISNPNALYPATNFEIYQATKTGGPYQFVGITPASELTFTKEALTPGIKYYFVVRAVNNSGAAALSNEANATTDSDNTPPSAPFNLKVIGTTRSSVSLTWDESTDDVAMDHYDIYVNGVKAYYTNNAEYTVYNLDSNKLYTFSIKAKDVSGNESSASNQVSAQTILKGIRYKYYVGTWDVLPDFDKISPTKTGFVPNINIDNRTQEENFAYVWEGDIRIPVAGNYTFRTNSDDGSKLYLGTAYSINTQALVNNDGLHGAQDRDGTILLAAGAYKLTVTFFQKGGGKSIAVSWKNPQTSNSFVAIPDTAFIDPVPVAGGTVPNKPSGLVATAQAYNKIALNWTDNSNNENNFELLRSENAIDEYVTVGVLPAGATNFIDTTVLPSTKYYYKVRAINQFGQSAFDKEGRGVNYAYYETGTLSTLPAFNSLIPVKTGRSGTFALGMENRSDNFAVKFDGTITVPNNGTYTFYLTSDAGSKLYIGGFSEGNRVVNHDGIHSATEQSGTKQLSPGTYPITVTYFEATGTEALSVSYRGPGGSPSKQVIPVNILGEEPASATTQAAPPAPAVPSGLDAFGFNQSVIKLVWVDNSAGAATKYEVYRSYLNNQNFLLYSVLPGNAASFTDTALYPNTLFYYKVRAVGVGGESAFSNEDSAKTFGAIPVLNVIENQYMRYGTQLQIPVNASNGSSEPLSIIVNNLPPFGTFAPTGNGKGTITFNPAQNQQGVYNITVKAANTQNDTVSVSFSLVVNDNYLPEIGNISDVTLNEKQTVQVTITATDLDPADQLLWTFLNLPSFVSVSDTNRQAKLVISPNYAQAGTYKVIAKVEDGRNGKDTVSFTIKVNSTAINPEKVYVNFNDASGTVPVPGPGSKWNSTTSAPSQNANFANLKNDAGVNSGMSIRIVDAGLSSANSGVNTGNNSGIYPDSVMRSQYRVGANSKNFRISGLTVGKRYNFTFFGSHNQTDRDYTAIYTMKGQSVQLNAGGNRQNTVSVLNVQPENDGTLILNFAKAGTNTSGYAYLNALVIETVFDDSTLPAKPKDFVAVFEDGVVKLNWTNVAYNAVTYEVYRSNNLVGPFVLMNPGVIDDQLQSFTDTTIVGNKSYYYIVRAKNNYGGTNSQTLKVVIPNKAPSFNGLNDIYIKAEQTIDVNVKAIDDVADNITMSVTGLPAFATFTDNDGGNGVIHISSSTTPATYSGITVTATDNHGAKTERIISINVIDKQITSTYINFNNTEMAPAAFPWNNFNTTTTGTAASVPSGTTLSGVRDETNALTTINVQVNGGWNAFNAGAITENNTGVFPDNVIRTGFRSSASTSRTVSVVGLNPDKKYNLIFYGNSNVVNTPNSKYGVGTDTVALDVVNNLTNTVQLNGLTPTPAGRIDFSVTRGASAYAYLNALVIQSYDNNVILAPYNLKMTKSTKNSVSLAWQNNTAGVTSFEIWRSTSPLTGYQLLPASVPGTTKTFTDNGLLAGNVYYYKVRALVGAIYSDFSNYVGAATAIYTININFNDGSQLAPAEPSPWNNINEIFTAGYLLENMWNDNSKRTGVDLVLVDEFSSFSGNNRADNTMSTGNNSGVVPDNVMSSFYFLNYGVTAKVRIQGLNQALRYNFSFFASCKDKGRGQTTTYVIGNKGVHLDSKNNTMNTADLTNIQPDATGGVDIIIYGSVQGGLGLLNSLSISAVIPVAESGDGNPSGRKASGTRANVNDITNMAIVTTTDTTTKVGNDDISDINTYPNPFVDNLTVKLTLKKAKSQVVFLIKDFTGKTMFRRTFDNAPAGTSQYNLGVNARAFTTGIYGLQVITLPDGNSKTAKIIKK